MKPLSPFNARPRVSADALDRLLPDAQSPHPSFARQERRTFRRGLIPVAYTQQYHAHYFTARTGPLYSGRFKSFPIQENDHV